MQVWNAVLLNSVIFALSTQAVYAENSFGCSETTRAVAGAADQQICDFFDLAQRDRLNNQIFNRLRHRADTHDATMKAARKFLVARRACGANGDCIRNAQETELANFKKIAEPNSETPEPPVEIEAGSDDPAATASESTQQNLAAPADTFQETSVSLQRDTYRSSARYEQVKAYCELFADSSARGHFAFGSIGFVVGATIGAAIGNAVEHAHAYEMCMVMKGYPSESH